MIVNTPLPKPPLNRVMKEGTGHFCTICGSTMSRSGWFGLFGRRLCDNKSCDNSINRLPKYRNPPPPPPEIILTTNERVEKLLIKRIYLSGELECIDEEIKFLKSQ